MEESGRVPWRRSLPRQSGPPYRAGAGVLLELCGYGKAEECKSAGLLAKFPGKYVGITSPQPALATCPASFPEEKIPRTLCGGSLGDLIFRKKPLGFKVTQRAW